MADLRCVPTAVEEPIGANAMAKVAATFEGTKHRLHRAERRSGGPAIRRPIRSVDGGSLTLCNGQPVERATVMLPQRRDRGRVERLAGSHRRAPGQVAGR
jgi:hypothetical protein